MRVRAVVAIAAFAILVAAAPAHSHAPLEGAGDFYTGLLHPVVVPAELLASAAVGLLLGFCGLSHCRLGIAASAVGLTLGLSVGIWEPGGVGADLLLLGVALAAAVTVTCGLRLPLAATSLFALLGGFAVGVDARPDASSFSSAVLAGAATVLGGTVLTLCIAALVLSRRKFWQEVAVRVASSWITASVVLYIAWLIFLPAV